MDKEKIFSIIEQCIEKAAKDFLEGKAVDCQTLQVLLDSVRIVHHAISAERH